MSNNNYEKWIQGFIKDELLDRDDLLPPWLKYPEIPRYSIGWRMGSGEPYMMAWRTWLKRFSQKQLVDYFSKYTPIPLDWLDLVASQLGHSVSDDMYGDDGNGDFAGIRWLEENGLANFDEFKNWYDESLRKRKNKGQ